MEPLTALGLACNVMQIISFTCETVQIYKGVRRNGHADPDLAAAADRLAESSRRLESTLNSVGHKKTSLSPPQNQLLDIAKSCRSSATAVSEELGKITAAHGGALGRMLQTLIRKSKLEQLEKAMALHGQVLRTRLLSELWDKQDAAMLQQQTDFASLDKTLQDSVRAYLQGKRQILDILDNKAGEAAATLAAQHLETRDLITSQHGVARDLTRSEHERTRRCVFQAQEATKQANSKRLWDDGVKQTLESLKFSDINARRNQIVDSYEGTFDWVFANEDLTPSNPEERVDQEATTDDILPWQRVRLQKIDMFKHWLKSSQALFWISGKPGSGKSTLMKFLASNHQTTKMLREWSPDCIICSYFIWNSGTLLQRNLKGMLCSLLYQLLDQNRIIAMTMIEKHHLLGHKRSESDWGLKEILIVLEDTIASYDAAICMFIDGLDEIDKGDGPEDLSGVFQSIMQTKSKFKMCVSSRPETYWRQHFQHQGCASFKLQDLTGPDLRIVAQKMLEKLITSSSHGQARYTMDGLVRRLVIKAEGVFLWLCMATKSLQRGIVNRDDEHALIKRIDALPSDLQSLYQGMLSRLGDDEMTYRREAAGYFAVAMDNHSLPFIPLMIYCTPSLRGRILKADPRLFRTEDLMEECKEFRIRLESVSAGLLDFNDYTYISVDNIKPFEFLYVSFIHRTARDFLAHTDIGREILELEVSTQESRQSRFESALTLSELFYAIYSARNGNPSYRTRMQNNYGVEPILSSKGFPHLELNPHEQSQVFTQLEMVYRHNDLTYLAEQAFRCHIMYPAGRLLKDGQIDSDLVPWLHSYMLGMTTRRHFRANEIEPYNLTKLRSQASHYASELLEKGIDPNHERVIELCSSPVRLYQMLNTFESYFFGRFGNDSLWSVDLGLIRKLLECSSHLEHKIIICAPSPSYLVEEFIDPLAFRSVVNHAPSCFLLEVYTAGLAKDALRQVASKWRDIFSYDTELQIPYSQSLQELTFGSQRCHRELLLYIYKDDDGVLLSKRLTQSQSGRILELTDMSNVPVSPDLHYVEIKGDEAASGWRLPSDQDVDEAGIGLDDGTPGVQGNVSDDDYPRDIPAIWNRYTRQELQDRIERILEEQEDYVEDVPGFLRDRGFFIPTDEDVERYKNAPDLPSRLRVIKELNEKKAAWPGYQAQFPSDTGEKLKNFKFTYS